MKHTIKAFAYLIDHQDGGGSTTIYPSLDALQRDRFSWEGKYPDCETKEESDAKLQAVLDEEDPYENGEIDETTIEIEQLEDGTFVLAEKIHCSWGQ